MKRPMLGLFVVAGIIILLSLFQWQGLDSMLDPVDMQLRFLQNSEKLELISLEPVGPSKFTPDMPPQYAGSKVLGSTEIKEPATRALLIQALRTNLDKSGASGAKCFWPRHSLRAATGKRTMEWVICFQCSWVHTHVDGDMDNIRNKLVLKSDLPENPAEPVFDEVLKNAGVPLAPKSK